MLLPYPCPPVPEDSLTIAWDTLHEPWVAPMAACQQDPEHHAEGDVWTHTKMVCESKSKIQAAYDGVKEIGFTVTSITMVIVVVFLPIALTNGYHVKYYAPVFYCDCDLNNAVITGVIHNGSFSIFKIWKIREIDR